MKEEIVIYDREWMLLWTVDRKQFIEEQKEEFMKCSGVTRAAWSIWVLMMDTAKRIRLVKRWNTSECSFVFDKAVWWHARPWESPDVTAMREVWEELWIKSVVASDENEFSTLLKKVDLNKVAVLQIIDHDKWLRAMINPKNEDDPPYERRFNATIFFAIYDWKFRLDNLEAVSHESIDLDRVIDMINSEPEKYTSWLQDLIAKYSWKMNQLFKVHFDLM
ncbi:MAG: NUDIX hydrolase [uncultured bacterium (gcode 4)]|uniref:NUDIX hydrolase n=1 Tax=uncultured bacterium (gcode 4) TaxID=1234023 RepID=K2G2U5_9BACT|nr:MAG: NUDIX hydrolase [uncultured bacterium (gcode 4)]